MNTVLSRTAPARAVRRKQVAQAGRFRSRTRIDGLQQLESKILLANFTVSIANDENDGNFAANDLSLREAVAQANSLAGADTITFNSGLGTLTLTAGQLEITSDINVVGLGVDNTVISGNNSSRIFNVQATGALTLSGARLQNGSAFLGGAIENAGALTVRNSDFLNNSTNGGSGGAIRTNGTGSTFLIEGSTFRNNTTPGSGGAISISGGSMGEIRNSTFSGNTAVLHGGAINVNGAGTSLTMRNSTVAMNRASINTAGAGMSGGIVNFGGTVTLHNTLLVGNTKNPTNTLSDLENAPLNAASSNNLIGSVAFAGGVTHGTNGNIVGNDHDNNAGTARIDWQANQVLNTTLASNGGPTLTHALIANSPAMDAGNNAQVPMMNLARLPGVTVSQSSTLSGNPAFSPDKALDGALGTFAHTASADTSPSWTVHLGPGSPRLITQIVLTNREILQGRLRDITVQVLDASGFAVFTSAILNPRSTAGNNVDVGPATLTVNLPAGVFGTQVRVTRLPQPGLGVADDNNTLTLAEVAVNGLVDQRGNPRILDSTDAGTTATTDIGAFETVKPQFLSYRTGDSAGLNAGLRIAFITDVPVNISRDLLRSTDAVADVTDLVLGRFDGVIGSTELFHLPSLTPAAADAPNDSSYRLLIAQTDDPANQAVFYGLYQKGSDLMIHGTDGNDVVTVNPTTVTINGTTFSHTATNVRAFLHGGNDVFTTTAGTMPVNVAGGDGNDTITGGTGADRLVGEAGDDSLIGGAGNDVYFFDADSALGTDTLSDAGGTEQLNFSATTGQAIALNMGLATVQVVNPNLSLILGSATTFENFLGGQAGNNVLGNTLINNLQGGTGNDTLAGAAGNDIYSFDADTAQGIDTVTDTAGTDTFDFSPTTTTGINIDMVALTSSMTNLRIDQTDGNQIENVTGTALSDLIIGNTLNNIINAGDGADRLLGQGGDDSLNGQGGDDSYEFDVALTNGADVLTDTAGNDSIRFAGNAAVTFNLGLSTAQQAVVGTTSIRLATTATFENIFGGSGNDTLIGNTLANVLSGGLGNDHLQGATGNDIYQFDTDSSLGSDQITDTGGIDTVDFSLSDLGTTLNLGLITVQTVNPNLQLKLNSATAIENATGGSGGDSFSGNTLGNTLRGNGGSDTLISGAGNDSLLGGLGNDVYGFDADNVLGTDTLTELAGEGADTLDFSQTAAAIAVNLSLTTQQTVVASKLNLRLTAGDTFENVIDGAGSDTVTGNSLNNVFTIQGMNVATGSYHGGAGNDTFLFSSTAVILISHIQGGDDSDTLDFSARSENLNLTISGLSGIENLIGGAGNDTLTGNSAANVIQGGNGNDTIHGADGHDTLRGDGGDDQLFGDLGSDALEGGAGSDLLNGGTDLEADLYLFNADTQLNLDTIVDAAGGGQAILDFSSGSTAISYNAATVGNQVINANLLLNLDQLTTSRVIYGSQGNDTLTGGTGDDNLQGSGGNDVISGGDGNDRIDGNEGSDTINGGNHDDQLFGGAGDNSSDSLLGGAGNDTYLFTENAGFDTFSETGGSGIDTVQYLGAANISINLGVAFSQPVAPGTGINLLSATAFENAVGGLGNDTLTGNTLPNRLDGGDAGNDSLNGVGGDDTYVLIGTPGTDTITDVSGVDTLDFTGNNNGFTLNLTVAASQSIGASSFVVNANLAENIIDGGGNNTYTGNNANNRFVDGAGIDSYNGAVGDDTYVFIPGISSGGTSIPDSGATGTDTMDFSAFTTDHYLDLGYFNSVEKLISGSGNDLLIGNDLANLIQGGGGNDTLLGGQGNDSLQGGLGDDSYFFSANAGAALGTDLITELANQGSDTVNFSPAAVPAFGVTFSPTAVGVAFNLSLTTAQPVNANLSLQLNLGTTVEHLIGGSGNDTLIGNTLSNQLTGGAGNDTITGSTGNDTYLFDADSPLGVDTLNDASGIDRIDLSATTTQSANLNLGLATIQPVNGNLGLILGSATAFEEAAGSQLSSILLGNSLANRLIGGNRDDVLTGGAGNDTLVGGGGTNILVFDADSALGIDTIDQTVSGTAQLDFSSTTTTNAAVNATLLTQQVVNSNLSLIFLRNTMNVAFVGTPLADTFRGGLGDVNVFDGLGGSDTLIGSGGVNTLQYFRFDADTALGTDSLTIQAGSTGVLDFSSTATLGINLNLSNTGVNQVLNANLTLSLTGAFTNVFGTQMNDVIRGTSLNDILVGDGGNDTLNGGGGRDILIGGAGADELRGEDEEDLLIGSLLFQASTYTVVGLGGIMLEWQRPEVSYLDRVDHLRNGTGANGTSVVNSLSVTDDGGATDILFGGDGLDWFWLFGSDSIGDGEIRN